MGCMDRALPDVAAKGSAPAGGCCGRERPGSARVGYTFALAFPAELSPFHLMSLQHAEFHVHQEDACFAVPTFKAREQLLLVALLSAEKQTPLPCKCESLVNKFIALGGVAVLGVSLKDFAVFMGGKMQASHRIDSGT